MKVASALTERAFQENRRLDWEALDALLTKLGARSVKKLDKREILLLPMLYRNVCADLAGAQAARYSAPLIDYLRGLTASAHTVLYGHDTRGRRDEEAAEGENLRALLSRAWLVAFPRAVRHRWRAMVLATLLFFVPFALGIMLSLRDPGFAFRVVPEAMLRPLTEVYKQGVDQGRGTGDNTFMAGFYVYNNVGIALRCFALGIFGGLGSALYLVQNGLFTGAVFGYVASEGAGLNIFTFIIGHGSLELGAIVLAGGAGLSLGWSVVAPGNLPRIVSVQKCAREILVIVGGATVMLLLAAAIEGFWSASSAPRAVKLVIGGSMFLLVTTYVLFAGRGDSATPEKGKARH